MRALIRGAVLASVTAALCGAQGSDEFLARLDRFAQSFHGIKADLQVTNHLAALGAMGEDKDSGSIVIKRDAPSKIRMMLSFTGANASTIVLREQLAEIYKPKVNEVDVYDIRQYREIAHQLFQLGFGAAGSDLAKNYTIQIFRREAVGNENTSYLELVPKAAEVRKQLSKVELWYSEKTNCAVRQKLYFPDGDYRLAEFSNLLLNPNIPNSTFEPPKSAKRVRMN